MFIAGEGEAGAITARVIASLHGHRYGHNGESDTLRCVMPLPLVGHDEAWYAVLLLYVHM